MKRIRLKDSNLELFNEINKEATYKAFPTIEIENISVSSHTKVYWNCPKHPEHPYLADPAHKTSGRGCGVCHGLQVIAEYNSLQALYPNELSEWDYTKNTVHPSAITPRSQQKVWWKCRKDGYSWETTPGHKVVDGTGCPVCACRVVMVGVNDLASRFPELLHEWDFSKNISLSPDTLVYGSNKKVWWKCKKNHSWKTSVVKRTGERTGCPSCGGNIFVKNENDLQAKNPSLAEQWHPTKNNGITPADVSHQAQKRFWWLCGEGHEWEALLSNRHKGRNCPYCAGKIVMPGINDIASRHPRLLAQWDYTKNELDPSRVHFGSYTPVWWKCNEGHEWESAPKHRHDNSVCRKCIPFGVSRIENRLRERLSLREGFEIYPKVFSDSSIIFGSRPITIDILLKTTTGLKIAIEYDGGFHSSVKAIERDIRKTNLLLENGYYVVRVRQKPCRFLELENSSLIQIQCLYSFEPVDLDPVVDQIVAFVTSL